MNPLPPNVDELVSAYLDGEATPEEIVVVESNTELMSRVDELRALARALAAPIVAPTDLKEAHIGAALGAFDELFASASIEADDSPVVAAVPSHPPARADGHDQGTSSVVSFEAARERRSRRFNTGVIAATAAAMILVVALAALSFGRSSQSNDVATAASESFETMAADESVSSAMVEPQAADGGDAGDLATGGLSESEGHRSAAPPAVAAAPQAESMDDGAMDAAEESGESDAANDASAFADDDAGSLMAEDADAAPFTLDILLGTFADQAELRNELEQTTAEDLRERIEAFEPGGFSGCQEVVPALAAVDSVTLLGQAVVGDRIVELHVLSSDNDGDSFVVVDPLDGCSIVSTIP